MDDNGDSGWIKGLPAGWIDGFICARRLLTHFKADNTSADPAPWHNVAFAELCGPHFGKTPAEYTRNEKLSARLVAVIQRAVFSNQITGSWFDGNEFKGIPAQSFFNWQNVHNALLNGGFEVDPLWPDEWQRWSNQGWAIPKEQFETWMQSDQPLSMAGLPIQDDERPRSEVSAITARKPSDSSRVPLSEAVTWLAFGIALDAERLERAIRWECLADGDLQAAQRQLEAATNNLLKAGADGLIAFYGRHMEVHGERGRRTEVINPLTLDDYRKALIVSHDNLYYGEGLFTWYRATNEKHSQGSERRDHYSGVTVDREALLGHFGLKQDTDAAPSQSNVHIRAASGKRRPGPAPDPDWPYAIAKVTQDCIAAGYTRPLKRGAKAAIQTMLLSYMANKDKHFSDDAAAKHAKAVIAALPDN